MTTEHRIVFPPFSLDLANEQLWRGTQLLPLPPKPFAILRYLLEHAERLVSKEELLKAIWGNIYVAEEILNTYIRQLRRVLGDEAKAPRYIATVVGRGYRFLPVVSTTPPVSGSRFQVPGQNTDLRETRSQKRETLLVGREGELAQLHNLLEKALRGERQMVFVTGEPGIGKTTLVEAFLSGIGQRGTGNGEQGNQKAKEKTHITKMTGPRSPTPVPWITWGQCVEHYGVGEAYLPVLEALGRLCRQSESENLTVLLGRQAPTWLAQLPGLVGEAEFEVLLRKVQGATRERMLRELAEALEIITAERPLILWLEDLQWSDYSTIDFLSSLAQRREAARLLVIGAYRPADVLLSGHPLKAVKQELRTHRRCVELPLEFLSEAAVAQYLAVRFPGSALPVALGQMLHRSTDGNPLFMVNVVEHLVGQEMLVESDGKWDLKVGIDEVAVGVPETLRQMIERQIERLSPEEQQILEVASVVEMEWAAEIVAAGLKAEVEEVEAKCEELVRRGQFLLSIGMEQWPDGAVSERYRFIHALYREVLYDRVAAARRVRLHRLIGEREERGYGDRAAEIAGELAVHFEQGQDYRRAVQYLGQAAGNATRRHAYQEAIGRLTRGLELLKALPDTPERTQQELRLQVALGPVLMATKGYAAPEVEKAYTRARELCQQVGETPRIFQVLSGLCAFSLIRAEVQTARELGEQCLRLAQSVQSPYLLLSAHYMLGVTLFHLGELDSARTHLEQGIVLYDPQRHYSHREDLGVGCLSYAAWTLWFLGYPDQALKRSREALTLAQELALPFSLAFALSFGAFLHYFRREEQTAQELAEAAIKLSTEQGFPHWLWAGTVIHGWALTERGRRKEGIAQIRRGLFAWHTTGAETGRPYSLTILAEAYGKTGQVEEGLTTLAEALAVVHKTGQCEYEAELHRLTGELKAGAQRSEEAEKYFRRAIDVARRQSAKSLELRAVMNLCRLWRQQGKKEKARQLLAEIYDWFTEGLDTPDLRAAQALLRELN